MAITDESITTLYGEAGEFNLSKAKETFMMRKISLLLWGILFIGSITIAQDQQSIIASGAYYFGKATAEQEQEAQDRALKQLSEQIAVKVQSFTERDLVEKNGDLKDAYRNLIYTYSQVTLRNVHSVSTKKGEGIEVFSYIAKSEVGKIFDERKVLVRNIYEKATEFEREGNITDALKYYYFAILLMNSIPERTVSDGALNLLTEIPARINNIINSTKFAVVTDNRISEKEREIELRIDVVGKPALQADFTFWDGSAQVQVHAVDGMGLVRLYGASVRFDELTIELKYNFYESRQEIAEVAELWDLVVKPTFKNSRLVPLKIAPASTSSIPSQVPVLSDLTLADTAHSPVAETIRRETTRLLELLTANDERKVRDAYKSDRFLAEKITALMRYNRVLAVASMAEAAINRTLIGWEVRQVPLLCSYPSLQRQSTEYLIIDFTDAGVLDDVNFGTLKTIYADFVGKGKFGDDWGNRQVIVKFVERYRTAFMTRNMAMLDSLFSDEAVIIIGRELKKTSRRDEVTYAKIDPAQPDYQYTQYTKAEYLKNQRRVFQTQRDIMLGFSSFKISRKNDSSGTYGIAMKQHYTSSTYADEGHLFLLVDFQKDHPQIYVRSWQPHEWNDDALINLSNFRVNK